MQAGRAYKKITFKIWQDGASDGAGGKLPGSWVDVLSTSCTYKQISSAILLDAMQYGSSEVFQVIVRKRNGFKPKMLVHKAEMDGENYVIKRVLDTFTDHIIDLIKDE